MDLSSKHEERECKTYHWLVTFRSDITSHKDEKLRGTPIRYLQQSNEGNN